MLKFVAAAILVHFTTLQVFSQEKSPAISDYVIIGYVHGNNQMVDFSKIPAEKLTHINYAFANVIDGVIVDGSAEDAENIAGLRDLKSTNPGIRILVSVGGWGWSKNFSDAVMDARAREIFANSAIEMVKNHQLDGIDLDWEYPGQIGGGNKFSIKDKENFTSVLALIRHKLDSLGGPDHHYLLTIATAANKKYLRHTEMGKAQKYLDYVNIMTYDFHGGWNKVTGHHANLKKSDSDPNHYALSAVQAVNEHVAAGVPKSKLVLGLPFYGRWWSKVEPKNHGLYQPSRGVAGAVKYRLLADSLINKNGFVQYFDSTAAAPYLWNVDSGTFVTFDNTGSFKLKCEYVKKEGLAGVMFWEYKGDDGSLVNSLHDNLNVDK